MLERDWLEKEILVGNEKIIEADPSRKGELVSVPELSHTIIRLQEMAEKYAIMASYIEHFGGNPFGYFGRQRAVNVHQNFTNTKRKPTVEFRRFNGTLSPDVVQANALLTTCLMKTAMEKSSEAIADGIEAAGRLQPAQRVTAFVDLITDDDNIKRVLLEAYFANLDRQQREEFQGVHGDEGTAEGEPV